MPSRRDPETGLVRRGTSNTNQRGSAETRRRRKDWLLETYAADKKLIRVKFTYKSEPIVERFVISVEDLREYPAVEWAEELPTARCFHCGTLLWFESLTVDRIKPGCKGGTYRRENIRPACAKHNSELGAPMARGKEHQAAKKAARKKAAKKTPQKAVA